MMGHWHLPGPRRFLEDVFQSLREGSCVVIQLPPHAPACIGEALRRLNSEMELRKWHAFDPEGVQSKNVFELANAIAKKVLSAAHQPSGGDFQSFVDALSDRLIYVELKDAVQWTLWADLLERVRLENHRAPEPDRPLFCLKLAPELGLPRSDIGLTVRRFWNVITPLDTRIEIEQRRIGYLADESSLRRQLAVTIGSCLAGSDLNLADFLAEQPLRRLLSPEELFEQYRTRNAWLNTNCPPNWVLGSEDCFGGSRYVHSVHPAVNGDSREIKRRIWKGQVAVLFPYLEERRQHLLPILTPILSGAGNIGNNDQLEHPMDLELGPLVRLLRNRNVPTAIWRELRTLRDIRHRLAHLETVPHELINDLH